jgi:hypothetical protein
VTASQSEIRVGWRSPCFVANLAFDEVAARLRCDIEAGSITRDDGTTGSWRMVESDDLSLPFYVAYEDADLRGGQWQDRVREEGNDDFGGFTFVEVGGDRASLRLAWR